jgi:hypothetical protein
MEILAALLGFGAFTYFAFKGDYGPKREYNPYRRHECTPTSTPEQFDAKIQGFGWDEPIEQTEVIKKQVKQVNKSKVPLENESLLSFLDKHFDLFSIDSELYTLNLNQIKNEQHMSINQRLRNILECKGLYDFEIDSYVINGSDATRMHMADRIR